MGPFVQRWAALAVMVASLGWLLVGYQAWQRPVLTDNQHYFYIAERAAAGVPPHVSHVDPKNMLAPMLSAVGIRAGRVVGLHDVHGARVVSLMVTAGAVSVAFVLGAELGGGLLGGWFAALAMLGYWALLHEGAIGVRPKVFMALFMLIAHLAALRRRHLGAGAAAAAAFLCWQPAGLVLPAVMLGTLVGPRRWRSTAAVVVGFAAVVGLYEAWFWWQGALAVQLDQAYRLPAGSSNPIPDPRRTLRMILHSTVAAPDSSRLVSSVALAVLLGVWMTAVDRPRRLERWMSANGPWLGLVAGASAALAWTFRDNQAYPDLIFVEPYFAVIFGAVVAWALRKLTPDPDHRSFRGIAVLGMSAWLLVGVWEQSARDRGDTRTLAEQIRAGRIVSALLERSDAVWAVGCTHLLGFNHADNWLPIGFFFDDIIQRIAADEDWRPLRDGRLPEILLLSRGMYPGAQRWMHGRYRELDIPLLNGQGVTVLERLDPEAVLLDRGARVP